MDKQEVPIMDIDDGTIMTDVRKNEWRVGKFVGKGSFGVVYLVSNDPKHAVTSENANYVIKIEPHSSGTLFTEIHCLMNAGKSIDESPLRPGMTEYIASGSHTLNNKRYRFLVLPRYKFDLHSVIKNRCIDEKNLLVIAIQTLDVLQHLHEKGYVHVDIKAENLMVGSCIEKRTTDDRIFLIDFGLARKFRTANDKHKLTSSIQWKRDGTLEFTSRDAHIGAYSRRSDLECLGYNLIFWSQGCLPWEDITQPEEIYPLKKHFMTEVNENLQKMYGEKVPKYLGEFLKYVGALAYPETPDYDYCRQMFLSALYRLGANSKDMKIDVNCLKSSPQCTVNAKQKQLKIEACRRALTKSSWSLRLRSKSNKIPKEQREQSAAKKDKNLLKRRKTDSCVQVKRVAAGKDSPVIHNIHYNCKKFNKPENLVSYKEDCSTENQPNGLLSICKHFGNNEEDSWECNNCQTYTTCNKCIVNSPTGADKTSGDGKIGFLGFNSDEVVESLEYKSNYLVQFARVHRLEQNRMEQLPPIGDDDMRNIFPRHAHVFKYHEIDGPSLYLIPVTRNRGDVVKRFGIKIGPAVKIYDQIIELRTKWNVAN